MFFVSSHTFEESFYCERGVDVPDQGAAISCIGDTNSNHGLLDHDIHEPAGYYNYFDELLTFKKRFNFFVG